MTRRSPSRLSAETPFPAHELGRRLLPLTRRREDPMRDIRWMRGALPGLLLGVSLSLVACDESSSGSGGAATTGSAVATAQASASAAAAAAAASASAAAAAQAEEHDKVDEASAMEDVRHFHRHHHH